ncbi:MAG: hypothetical protein LBK23_08145 [Oscillospiraceae bacterium]|jgi:hypothetical protein|nr:hypothetical protein [Oscillospiraceae bacterium]
MAKSNKELAVELYIALLKCRKAKYLRAPDPDKSGVVLPPSRADMILEISELAKALGEVPDK